MTTRVVGLHLRRVGLAARIKGRPSPRPRPRFYRGMAIFPRPRPRSGGQFLGSPRPRSKIDSKFLGLGEI